MGIYEDVALKIDSVCDKFAEIMKERNFALAREKSEAEVKYSVEVFTSLGYLALCKEKFNNDISYQAANIKEGIEKEFPVVQQERLLRETIIGYLMVREAEFLLNSVSTIDNITNAYNLLDSITKQISHIDSEVKLPKGNKLRQRAHKECEKIESSESVVQRQAEKTEAILQDVIKGIPIEEVLSSKTYQNSNKTYEKDSEKKFGKKFGKKADRKKENTDFNDESGFGDDSAAKAAFLGLDRS